jgi:hypothetical protein
MIGGKTEGREEEKNNFITLMIQVSCVTVKIIST